MANVRCEACDGRGIQNRNGKGTKTGKPYDVVCPNCNGVGHYRARD
jgi:DnaJ-class molecular chaperone